MSKPSVKLNTYEDRRPWGYMLKRVLWACVQLPFWVRVPRIMNPVRIALLRMFGATIGRRCLVGSVRIWIPWNLEMGDYSAIGEGAEIYNLAPVQIGANSVVSQRSYLCTATHDYTKSNFPLYSLPITIGASAWVAAAVFVAPGIRIGEGAVIGACSVVTKDVPPWMVCAGNPCRAIKSRNLSDATEFQVSIEAIPENAQARSQR